jgi:signal transduction histidine kinase
MSRAAGMRMTSVADTIDERREEIVALWMGETRKIAAAKGLAYSALQNVMPRYLVALGRHLRDPGAHDPQLDQHFQNHVSTRMRQGYDLAEILREFITLGRCIAKMWSARPPGEWPQTAEVDQLHDAIQTAITEATDTFHRHMFEDEQSEKRYLRQLQRLATESMRNEPPGAQLREMLGVIMEAMAAQCAAFLVYSRPKAELVLVACTGAEALEPYASSLDPKSFVAQVAANEEATQIFDARVTQLEVPHALVAAGIHGLLGVRLPEDKDLLGVMYIGVTAARMFTHREVRRIESLGERFALHLENARLFTELREKITALHDERALRERFVSILAHDLRGPLSSARLTVDLLREHPTNTAPIATKLQGYLDRVDRMIHDLLDANRIRAGEPLPLRLEECELGSLAEHVVEEARALYGDRFVVECRAPVRGVWGPDELHRTIWNLVTNAVKHGANRPVTITVTRTDDQARVTVHNEGAPIPPQELPRIFEAYARVNPGSGQRDGWGLGLTLVRGSVAAHGGRVDVTSDETGTTFTLELPLDARAFQPAAAPTVH